MIFALPLDFHGRVRVVRSMYLPAALHGIEASLLASESLRKLRSSIRRVVWSHRQPMASDGAVLSLLDGPTGCGPAFCVVWFGFRLLRRYLALWPSEVGRVHRILEMVGEGCPGHGPIHLLSASDAEIGFRWDPDALAWSRPGSPQLSKLAGPLQHFKAAFLLNSSHVRERDKALLRSIMVWGVRNGLLLCRVRSQVLPCRFCGAPDGDGHLFWECTFPPLVEIRENPEFHDLILGVCFGMVGFLCFLVLTVPPLGLLVRLRVLVTFLKLRLGATLLVWLLNEVPLMGMTGSLFPLWFWITPMSGLMAALSLIRSLPCLLLELFFLLTSLWTSGVIVGGVMLIMFALRVKFSLAEVSVQSLGLSSLFKELRCGVSF